MARLLEFRDPALLAAALTQQVARRLKEDLLQQDRVTLVVSGGQSPVAAFQALANQPLPWERVAVTLADERWVPPTHPASNEALVRAQLLKGRAAAASFLPFWSGTATPEQAVLPLTAALQALPQPASQVLLGLGEDGHTASLFPGAPELLEGLTTEAPVLALRPPQGSHQAPHARLSLSLRALLRSRAIALLLIGPRKGEVLEAALGAGPVEAMPVRALLRQTEVPVSIFWAP